MNSDNLFMTGAIDSEVVTSDIAYMRTVIANICFVGDPIQGNWMLVDTGIAKCADAIKKYAEARFGRPPILILLTHGHFDHVGNVIELASYWDVPIYAHEKELPFLTGKQDYPPGDGSVGGGMMAMIAPMYPYKSIQLGNEIQTLPADGTVPGMDEWRVIPTPGHTPGHISLYRDRDGVLIVGDAFITVKQESALAVMKQEKELHGPPTYFTPDWDMARESVELLSTIPIQLAITGHGVPIGGAELTEGLQELALRFNELAVPKEGRYVEKGNNNDI